MRRIIDVMLLLFEKFFSSSSIGYSSFSTFPCSLVEHKKQRFLGIVITTLKRRRVTSLNRHHCASAASGHHFSNRFMFYVYLHGSCLWERRLVVFIHSQHLTLSLCCSSLLYRATAHPLLVSRSFFVRYLLPTPYLLSFFYCF